MVAATATPPPELESYLAKVHDCAYTVTDADVDALKDAGISEDAIFEQTVAVAIAEGLRRLDAAEGDRMRLDCVDTGHAPARRPCCRRSASRAAPSRSGRQDARLPAGDLRPPVLGGARRVMRGPSDWSPGERELFAAFTSLLHECHF